MPKDSLHVTHMTGFEPPPPEPTPVSVWTMQAAREKSEAERKPASKHETEK